MRRACLVTGSASQIASWLVPRLIGTDWEPHILSRGVHRPDHGPIAQWHPFDLADESSTIPPVEGDVLFHTAQIDLLPAWIDRLPSRGVGRVVAFSTTSILTKTDSSDRAEREQMAKLARAEHEVAEACARAAIRYTIFRPTLIYGGQLGDRTISDVTKIVDRFGVFPLFSGGAGLRQPVHAADLADACLRACDCVATFDKFYNLPGGEMLTYRAMIERIFVAVGRKPRFVEPPAWVFSLAIGLARLHPRFHHLNGEMARRMQKHLIFDFNEAATDFGYSPRGFQPAIRS